MCHWSHPHYIAWFPNIHPRVTIIGSMLEYALNCVGFSWASSPALTEMEQLVLDWLADIFGLPDHFKFHSKTAGGGAFQGTAGEGLGKMIVLNYYCLAPLRTPYIRTMMYLMYLNFFKQFSGPKNKT